MIYSDIEVSLMDLREFDSRIGKLREINVRTQIRRIESMGFVRTMRPGDTGIGFTLETLLGLRETNVRGKRDFAYEEEPIELKSQRRTTMSMVTLFAMEPHKAGFDDRRMITTYGYIDSHQRKALKTTLKTKSFTPQGLKLTIEKENKKLVINDRKGLELWYWNINDLKPKIGRLLLIFADSRGMGKEEEFHYNEAYILSEFQIEQFFTLFDKGFLVIDLRMHILRNNVVRNHGTAFRIRNLNELLNCYSNKEKLL